MALASTADAGSSWPAETSDTANEYGNVSCAPVSLCKATTDGAPWVSPHVSARTGHEVTVTRQYHQLPGTSPAATSVPAAVRVRTAGGTSKLVAADHFKY